jgi:hypothetical protein
MQFTIQVVKNIVSEIVLQNEGFALFSWLLSRKLRKSRKLSQMEEHVLHNEIAFLSYLNSTKWLICNNGYDMAVLRANQTNQEFEF